MILTRIWFCLVAVAAAALASLLLIVEKPAVREINTEQQIRLDQAQFAAALDVRAHARVWLDRVSLLTADAALADACDRFGDLAGAGGGKADLVLLHRTAQDRLHAFNERIAAEILWAVDRDGRVVARAGMDEKEWGDGLIGYPLVERAVRGLVRDDVWSLGGQLYQMAAAPIVRRDRGRYAGALIAGTRIGDAWARALADRVGVDVAVFLRGKVIGASLSSTVLYSIPPLAEAHRAQMADKGRSVAIPLDSGGEHHLAVLAPWKGEAAGHDAVYALLVPRTASEGLRGLFARVRREDVARGFPWPFVAAGLVMVLTVGFLLFSFEYGSPMRRLVEQCRDAAGGMTAKIDDTALRARFGTIGRLVNEVIERLGKARPKTARDLSSILDTGARPALSAPGLAGGAAPAPPPGAALPAGAPGAGGLAGGTLAFSAPPPVPSGRPPGPPLPSPTGTMPRSPGTATPPPMPPPTPAGVPPPAPPPSVPPAAGVVAPGMPLRPPGAAPPRPATPAPRPAPPAAGPASADGEFERHVQEVFEAYMDSRRRLGEGSAGVTLDKFRAKLAQNRDLLVSRQGCRDVRFSVYEKDGRTAVKATPIR